MNLLRAAIGAVAVLLLAACAPGPGHTSSRDAAVTGHISARGMVTGRFLLEGGPLGPGGRQPRERPIAERCCSTPGWPRCQGPGG